jgi:MarR family transcriptional regulator, negative regulator of the multidrug operon emrRAB
VSSRPVTDARRRNLLGATALALADRMRATVDSASDVSGEAAAALAVIAQQPRGTVEDLRQAIGRSQPATVRIVDRLVEHGLVERRPGDRGPALALVVTARGRRQARAIVAARDRVLAEALQGLDRRTAAALESALTHLLVRLSELPDGLSVCRLCDKGPCRGSGDCPLASALEAQGIDMRPGDSL